MESRQLELQCGNGGKAFLTAQTDRVTATAKCLLFTKKIWEFEFPYSVEAGTLDEILQTAAEPVKEADSVKDLRVLLKYNAAGALRAYFAGRNPEAAASGASPQKALSPKEFQAMEAVVKSYARVLERVGQETMEKYQAGFYPISYLPYPKEKIRNALKLAIDHSTDPKMTENLKGCEKFLDHFIDDATARKRNAKAKEENPGEGKA